MYYEVVQVGMVTFTAFSCGMLVRTFVTAYKENRSPSGSVDTKQRPLCSRARAPNNAGSDGHTDKFTHAFHKQPLPLSQRSESGTSVALADCERQYEHPHTTSFSISTLNHGIDFGVWYFMVGLSST